MENFLSLSQYSNSAGWQDRHRPEWATVLKAQQHLVGLKCLYPLGCWLYGSGELGPINVHSTSPWRPASLTLSHMAFYKPRIFVK